MTHISVYKNKQSYLKLNQNNFHTIKDTKSELL